MSPVWQKKVNIRNKWDCCKFNVITFVTLSLQQSLDFVLYVSVLTGNMPASQYSRERPHLQKTHNIAFR